MYSEKWGMKYKALKNYFWGEYFMNVKKKKLSKKPISGANDLIFVQYVLKPLYRVYEAV